MRFSAPTTTLAFLGLATLAATTTTSTGNETCTPHNWLKYHVASSFWAAASAAFDLSDAAPITTALDLTCVGGLLAPTAKGTFVDLEGMGVHAATYSSLSSLAYLAAGLAILGSIWVAGIILVLYFALPDGPDEKRLSISANNDGSGAVTERFRFDSGLLSAARRVLQRVSVSLGVGRTSSVEAIKKEEGGEVMADGC